MRKALTAFIAASAVAFTVVCLPLATPTSAAACDDIKFIFARGSGQDLNGKDFVNFRTEVNHELQIQNSTLKYSFYELGSSTHGGASYPAVALNFFNIIGASISAGTAFSYGHSVEQGIAELKAYISEINSTCKNTKFVLAGYSQGAQVITLAIPDLNPQQIIYAATFGDPKLYLPEGNGLIPDACLGKNFSSYREYAPNCRTAAGSLGAKIPYQPTDWSGKIGLWCKDKDLVCGAGIKLSNGERSSNNLLEKIINKALLSHESYTEDGIFHLAAQTITKKLQKIYPRQFPIVASTAKNRDTVILIDKTGSMAKHIDHYKQEALRLARSTINDGGRIALYTYGDLAEETPKRLVDFGVDFEAFSAALSGITTDGGDDVPESLLSALLTVMNNQIWRAGATKSIVILTDTNFHNPDRDGTTLNQVIHRSLEIDPVNIYVVSTATYYNNDFTALTRPTNGQYFSTFGSASTDYLLARPNVNFLLNEYSGAPGQTFNFSVLAEGDIASYEWDLDFDGVFEATTSTPSITKTYDTDATGFAQVRVKTSSGVSSTGSTTVTISSSPIQTPTISNLDVNLSPDQFSAQINFTLSGSAIATLVAIDDASLGLTTKTQLSLTDITKPISLALTPLGTDGTFGEQKLVEISPLGKGSVTYLGSRPASSNPRTAEPASESTSSSGPASSEPASSSEHQSVNSPVTIPLAPDAGKH